MRTQMLVAFLIAAVLGYSIVPAAQSMTTCGQGIVLRNDTTIVVDAWRTYAASAQPANPTLAPAMPASTPAPAKIVLGESLADDLRVCVEAGDGTVCTTLGAVRKLAGAATQKR